MRPTQTEDHTDHKVSIKRVRSRSEIADHSAVAAVADAALLCSRKRNILHVVCATMLLCGARMPGANVCHPLEPVLYIAVEYSHFWCVTRQMVNDTSTHTETTAKKHDNDDHNDDTKVRCSHRYQSLSG